MTLISVILIAAPCRADCPPACDLSDLRALAIDNAPEIDRADASVDFDRARLLEARLAGLDLGRAAIEASPTPARRGTLANSAQPDISASDQMGLLATIAVDAALALTPWWTIVEYTRAARGAAEMSEHDRDRVQIQTLLAVERALLDVQAAEASLAALRRAERAIGQALARAELLLDEDLPGATETARLRLEVTRYDLEARRLRATAGRRRALARLRRLTGLRRGGRLELPPLPTPPTSLSPLDWQLEAARRHRPEVPLTLAAIRAARSLVRARQSELVPQLVIGLFYRFRGAPLVDDQRSPYAVDPWNGYGLGYGLAYRWSPSFGQHHASVDGARAELARARALRRFALGGIAYEVERAWVETQEAAVDLETRDRGRALANRRFDTLFQEAASGRVDAEALVDATNDWLGQALGAINATERLLDQHARLRAATGQLSDSD